MNKAIFTIIFTLSIFLPTMSYAYISGKDTINESPIFCPASVKCESRYFKNCTYDGDHRYWQSNMDNVQGPTGIYSLVRVKATYHSNAQDTPKCIYKHPSYGEGGIILEMKQEYNFDAYNDGKSYWNFSSGTGNCDINSKPGSVQLCPLKQRSAVRIKNIDINDGIILQVNSIRLRSVSRATYANVTFDDVIAQCSSERACKIDILSSAGFLFGSITVDMDDHLKIIETNPSRPTYVTFNKNESLDTIYVQFSH